MAQVTEQSSSSLPPARPFPIESLPTELLACVLYHASQDTPLEIPLRFSLKNRSPRCQFYPAIALTWVCARWRAIVLATPACWSPESIDIDLQAFADWSTDPVRHARTRARCLALLECYLTRSGLVPLVMNLDGSDNEEWMQAIDVVRLACSSAFRWQACRLPYFVADWLSETPTCAAPLLLEEAHVEGPYIARADFFAKSPRLRQWQGPVTFDVDKPHLRWGQLTHLLVDHPSEFVSVQFLMGFIAHCRQLVELGINVWRDPERAMPPRGAEVVLPHLLSVQFTLDDQDVLAHILASFTLPALSNLSLLGCNAIDDEWQEPFGHLRLQRWPVEEFEGFLERSQCSLRTLHIIFLAIPQDDIIRIMHKLPHISDFALDEREIKDGRGQPTSSSINDALLQRLSSVDGSAPELLPRLERLAIKGVLNFDWQMLLTMVKSRTNPRLQHLHIFVDDSSRSDIDQDTEERLMEHLGRYGFWNHCGVRLGWKRHPLLIDIEGMPT
ncbi:uncharacterized protein SCHCODRAFT_02061325 [Schizophyllum commune H4-8]|nr:uncharacterized protein SCHCODRAFT_02061325 [Schizophyllum commune H4-8]KAI5888737.1 hypothetical protein SCHCODRAFT_02061325 [Schizophyllum commune H4-8]